MLKELLLAWFFISGAHTIGHIQEGHDQRKPVSVKGFAEHWNEGKDVNADSRIHGAGFRIQDKLGDMMDSTDMGQATHLANALYKIGFLSGSTRLVGLDGDIENLKKNTGSPVNVFIGLSALMDLYKVKNPQSSWQLNFWQSELGTPGLTFSFSLPD